MKPAKHKFTLLKQVIENIPAYLAAKLAAVMARSLSNQLRDGEIVVFDKAYVDFKHLFELMQRGILWVTRAKSNMKYRVVKKLKRTNKSIVLDAKIKLQGPKSKKEYPDELSSGLYSLKLGFS